MFSRIFGRDRDADKLSNDQYLPMFSDAFQSIIEYGKYDPRDDMNVLLEELSDENQSISSQELVNLLASRDNPFSRLLESRAKLKAVKPEDRRFSNNLHRRIIFFIDFSEQELVTLLDYAGVATLNVTNAEAYRNGEAERARARRRSELTSQRKEHYLYKLNDELGFHFRKSPDLRDFFESFLPREWIRDWENG